MFKFSYASAFERNLGWVTEWEQYALRAKRVAIAGLGGAGGAHLLTLTRLGIGAFTIADFDTFDVPNLNRQAGATVATIGRPKTAVMEEMALAINPELHIRRFDTGITAAQVDSFLDGADLFVDGLDFFELGIRRQVFARCAAHGIPAITAAPIGMSTGFLIFVPGGMSFEKYFRFEGQTETEQFLRFLVGLTPAGLHRPYLVDPTRVDLAARKGPSTVAAIQLCAGVTAAAAVKVLLRRGGVKAAPWYHQYDAYRDRLVTRRLCFGNASPLQQLKLAIGRRQFLRHSTTAPPAAPQAPLSSSTLDEILDLARWAPSGDNTQPWRFRVIDEQTVRLTLGHNPAGQFYEYRDGEPTMLSCGMLIETIRLAASTKGRDLDWELPERDAPSELLLRFPLAPERAPDPLAACIPLRSVDRRGFRRRRLTESEKLALTACLDSDLGIDWHETPKARWALGALNSAATAIRLRAAEAFPIHQRVVDWNHRFSPDRIPAEAIGLPTLTLPLLRWAMRRPERIRVLNQLGGASLTALHLDRLPAWNSGAFFVVYCREGQAGEDRIARLLRIGMCLQRLWLTAASLRLALQPTLATLAFAEYGSSGIPFSTTPGMIPAAGRLARAFLQIARRNPAEVVFLGRIGEARPRLPLARSTRLTLAQLIEPRADNMSST